MKFLSSQWLLYHFKNNHGSLWLSSNRSLHVMAISGKPLSTIKDGPEFKVNSADDLTCFEETERWHNREEFLSVAAERIDAGEISITRVEDDRLAFVAWLAPATEQSTFGYVHQTVRFPPKTATEYGVYVHPAFRRRGLFKQGLKFLAAHAFDATGADILLGAVHSDNHAALHGHSQAGFEKIATLTERRFLGDTKSTAEAHNSGYMISCPPRGDSAWQLEKVSHA